MRADILALDPKNVQIELRSGLTNHPSSEQHRIAKGAKRLVLAYGEQVYVYEEGTWSQRKQNAWQALEAFQAKAKATIYGYLGYDLKNQLESLESRNEDPIGAPDLFFFEPLEEELLQVQSTSLDRQQLNKNTSANPVQVVSQGCSKQEYVKIIDQIKALIFEGEFYELNFSRLKQYFAPALNMYELFNRMSVYAPVPFSVYLNTALGIELACLSPERFLRKTGRKLLSQPIKGTRKRALSDPSMDSFLSNELRNSEKDQAENLMIVDLVRHDLNRVAKTDSVKVAELFGIQSFGTVHHMVSSIEAELREDISAFDALKVSFPMGSMTGAPKMRVMEWIESLENYKRGIYSGSIGYITKDLDYDFNVVIRTAIKHGDHIYYATGGAITSDSEPDEEWEETETKCAAFESILTLRSSVLQ